MSDLNVNYYVPAIRNGDKWKDENRISKIIKLSQNRVRFLQFFMFIKDVFLRRTKRSKSIVQWLCRRESAPIRRNRLAVSEKNICTISKIAVFTTLQWFGKYRTLNNIIKTKRSRLFRTDRIEVAVLLYNTIDSSRSRLVILSCVQLLILACYGNSAL